MPFTLKAFIDRRPFLYHFTAEENLAHIKSRRELTSAAKLSREGLYLSEKRPNAVALSANAETIWLQTQSPLHAANIAFEGGWQMSDLLACLNSQVFFWPGSEQGPIDYGVRHFSGNRWPTNAVALRAKTSDLLASTKSESVLFCHYNSGSPRYAHGKASPRGPNMFLPVKDFCGTLSDVVEVSVKDRVSLPASTESSESLDGTWRKLFLE